MGEANSRSEFMLLVALKVLSQVLEHVPNAEERTVRRFRKLQEQYRKEVRKAPRHRDSHLIDNLFDDMRDLLESISEDFRT